MDRLTLTPAQQNYVDSYRAENGVQPSDVIDPRTNLVVDDHLEIDYAWYVVVLGGEGSGVVNAYVPDWEYTGPIDLVGYVTGRAGPNGETMPIMLDAPAFDPSLAMAQKTPAPTTTKPGARSQEILKAQTPEVAKQLREHMKKHGLLPGGK